MRSRDNRKICPDIVQVNTLISSTFQNLNKVCAEDEVEKKVMQLEIVDDNASFAAITCNRK
jgi:hypothetical protein